MSVKRISLVILFVLVGGAFTYLGVSDAVKTHDSLDFQKVELKSRSTEIQELNVQYDQLNQKLNKASDDKQTNQKQIEDLQKQKQDLEQQKKDLETQLQAKIDAKSKLALASSSALKAVTGTATASADSISDIDCYNPTTAKAFVYCHESGNNPSKWNDSGCYGLGQDCNGIVYSQCGADYACQDAYFTSYMFRRYGSWENAKAFWLSAVPINGRYVGNWW